MNSLPSLQTLSESWALSLGLSDSYLSHCALPARSCTSRRLELRAEVEFQHSPWFRMGCLTVGATFSQILFLYNLAATKKVVFLFGWLVGLVFWGLIYLFNGRKSYGEGKTERDIQCTGSVSMWPPWLGLGQAIARNRELLPGVHLGSRAASISVLFSCFSWGISSRHRAHRGTAALQVALHALPWHRRRDVLPSWRPQTGMFISGASLTVSVNMDELSLMLCLWRVSVIFLCCLLVV